MGGGEVTRGVITAILTIALALPAVPQCNLSPILSDPFRSSILDLALDGNDLWAATSYGLSLYDRSVDPPRLTAMLAIPGTTRLIRLGNGLAYAGSGNSIAVVRKNGRSLQLIRSVDAGAPVNDMVVTTLALYVATRNGITQYSLIDPANPTANSTVFQTSQTSVSSLALIGGTLYAADGDSTVEVFSISPGVQRIGSIAMSSNATAIHTNNSKLFVSSPVQTTVLVGSGASMTEVGTTAFSMQSLAPISGDAIFAAGTDRTLRAIDFTTPGTPIDIFRDEVPASGGTINRLNALVTGSGRLYAGAGDAGIVPYDISFFSAPFPMRSFPFSNASSVVSTGTNFYVGRTNGINEFSQSPVPKRSWDGSRSDAVQDGDVATNFLLSSSGATITLWTLAPTIPQTVASATLRTSVVDAVLIGTTAYAVLSDRTLWTADMAQVQPVPQQIATPNIRPGSIARSGNAIAISDTRSDGTTLIAYYAAADFTADPKTATVQGLATSGVTLTNATAAVQTFRGITLIDFNSTITGVLPQSNTRVARQLFISGLMLFELTDTSVMIWNLLSQKVDLELMLPDQPLAMHAAPQSTALDIVTASSVIAIALDRTARTPTAASAPNGNAFYKRVLASRGHIDLFDGQSVDIFSDALHYIGSVKAAGLLDVAAGDNGLFTLSNNLSVAAYTPDGVPLSTAMISEGADAQPLSINVVNGAVWASIVRGCTSGACEKKTIIFNNNLSQTISLTGAITDVVTSGTRAYAITDLPNEIRVIDVSDPFHPVTIASRAAEGTPVSIAYSNGTIYVLGNTLASYSENGLAKIGDILGPYASDGTVTFVDQHVRINGSCAIITGRSFGPQLFNLPQWTPATSFGTPSAARAIAAQPGTFYVLTDHSLEIWSSAPLPKPARRAPGR